MPNSGLRPQVSAADGSTLRAELFAPVGEGPHPGVVVLHESFGLNDDMRRIARRFADAGYAALAPDLYSHGPRIVCLSRVMVDMLRGGVARKIADIRAARDVLTARPEVDSERIAVAGFCQGGGFALIAGTQPGFSAAAVNHGDVPADSPRLDGVCPVVASSGAMIASSGTGRPRVRAQRCAPLSAGRRRAGDVRRAAPRDARRRASRPSDPRSWRPSSSRPSRPERVGTPPRDQDAQSLEHQRCDTRRGRSPLGPRGHAAGTGPPTVLRRQSAQPR